MDTKSEEKLSFQAEVSRLLDIVANSLYSNKEIFLRELISNASDACDRLRYAALTEPGLLAGDPDFKIQLASDAKARTLTIADNGIGMTRDELIENLGTIARSGTAAFVSQMESQVESDGKGKSKSKSKTGGVSLIGQFGVGFYASFMVADKVEVTSRKAGEDQAWVWSSDGKGEFSISAASPESQDLVRGTRIVLSIKKDAAEYLDGPRLRNIVKTYSDHVAIPVAMTEGGKEETLNSASAIWRRPKSEITGEQYTEFYRHVAHAMDEPWLRLHFKVEGVIEYSGLLFVPTAQPFDLFTPERRHGVKLYVKRIFITDDCAELIPPYLRFLRGVIDTEDLALNISREMLQEHPVLAKISRAVTKRVLKELQKKAEKAPEEYAVFWEAFGAVLKEGLYEDAGQRDTLIELARFASTKSDGLISLADYVERMPEGQKEIFYISGNDADAVRRSPHLEGFKAKGIDVLLLSDPVDEFWIPSIGDFKGKIFKSVTRGGVDLSGFDSKEEDKDEKSKPETGEPGMDTLVAFLKLALKDAVKDVRRSERLTDSPVCLIADDGDMDMHLERLLKQHRQIDTASKRVLEINPKHNLILSLSKRLAAKGTEADGGDKSDTNAALDDAAWLLLDQARILEGEAVPDPAAFARRLTATVERGFGA